MIYAGAGNTSYHQLHTQLRPLKTHYNHVHFYPQSLLHPYPLISYPPVHTRSRTQDGFIDGIHEVGRKWTL